MFKIERTITVYKKGDEELVDEYVIEVGVEALQKLWEAQADDPEYNMVYPVTEQQRKGVEALLGEKLHLDKYDYFLECYTI